MGYFNFYLLRKLIRNLFNNKHFKKLLFFIVVFLFFLFIWNNVVNAFSIDDLSTSGFDNSQKEIIYNFIQEHKASYDSVFVAYGFLPNSRKSKVIFFLL